MVHGVIYSRVIPALAAWAGRPRTGPKFLPCSVRLRSEKARGLGQLEPAYWLLCQGAAAQLGFCPKPSLGLSDSTEAMATTSPRPDLQFSTPPFPSRLYWTCLPPPTWDQESHI